MIDFIKDRNNDGYKIILVKTVLVDTILLARIYSCQFDIRTMLTI